MICMTNWLTILYKDKINMSAIILGILLGLVLHILTREPIKTTWDFQNERKIKELEKEIDLLKRNLR